MDRFIVSNSPVDGRFVVVAIYQKGDKGGKGDKGDPATWEDMSDEDKAAFIAAVSGEFLPQHEAFEGNEGDTYTLSKTPKNGVVMCFLDASYVRATYDSETNTITTLNAYPSDGMELNVYYLSSQE